MANRLADATSPYLQQHADNPVDWWPWCDAAFEEAREREVPVLLSVGYAACHWCHVMAHESFEDEVTAQQMNTDFVCIKVDREERPDVDSVYMEATQALTGNGGWPMTVFITPGGGEPFFCGTYFPPTAAPGVPAFSEVLAAVSEAWRERREEIIEHGKSIVSQLSNRGLPQGSTLTPDSLAAAVLQLSSDYDPANGGFGGAPKFPPAMVVEFLLRYAHRTSDSAVLDMATGTCEGMARRGMYDQLGGGFARYAVDAEWVVPHFEKMLYDNALLLPVYTHLWRQTGSELGVRVARETADFLLRDLRTAEGGFSAALDADTDGVEGATYVWTPEQLAEVLGADHGVWAAQLLGVTEAGTFEHGASTLQLRTDPDHWTRWNALRSELFEARQQRPQPARDDKIVASWNGMAITALADLGALLGEPRYVDAARAAAELLLDVHLVDGRLRRTSRDGRVGTSAGVLEDYANVATGLLTLHQATAEGRWLTAAEQLLDTAQARFADGAGGFFDTADDAEALVRRPRDPVDGATPSGVSALGSALATYYALTSSSQHRSVAEQILASLSPVVEGYPRAAGTAASTAEALLAGPLEVAIVGPDSPERKAIELIARFSNRAGTVVVAGTPDQVGVPLLADRPAVDGKPTAYVCRGFVCDAPTTDADALREQVR